MSEAGKRRYGFSTLGPRAASTAPVAHQQLAREERTAGGNIRPSVGLESAEDLDRALNGA